MIELRVGDLVCHRNREEHKKVKVHQSKLNGVGIVMKIYESKRFYDIMWSSGYYEHGHWEGYDLKLLSRA